MRVRVSRWGNSMAVRLPRAVVEELHLEPGGELRLAITGEKLVLSPVPRRPKTYKLGDLLAEADRIGWQNQPRFEDWSAAEAPWPEWENDNGADDAGA